MTKLQGMYYRHVFLWNAIVSVGGECKNPLFVLCLAAGSLIPLWYAHTLKQTDLDEMTSMRCGTYRYTTIRTL